MFELHNLQVNHDNQTILHIEGLTIPSDQLCVVLGHNGSGKTTLMRCLARQTEPSKGEIHFNSNPLISLSQRKLAQQIGFLPQTLPSSPGLKVKELVQLGRFPWRGVWGRMQESDEHIVHDAMEQVSISKYANKYVEDLSGGERQRVWIAMLLAQQSPVLLLDEPTSALDIAHQYELMSLLKRLNQETGQGMIVILHDINLAARYADQIIAMKQGKCFFQGSVDELMNSERLQSLYGISMSLINHPENQSKVAIVC